MKIGSAAWVVIGSIVSLLGSVLTTIFTNRAILAREREAREHEAAERWKEKRIERQEQTLSDLQSALMECNHAVAGMATDAIVGVKEFNSLAKLTQARLRVTFVVSRVHDDNLRELIAEVHTAITNLIQKNALPIKELDPLFKAASAAIVRASNRIGEVMRNLYR